MKSFCFRFDVDSHRCLERGVPNLLGLGERLGVTFTFHVHMGRATVRTAALRDALRRGSGAVAMLSPFAKLGPVDLAVLLASNPAVGDRRPDLVAAIAAAGHEVGLHGGRNHRRWQDEAGSWSEARLEDEMEWSLARLAGAGIEGQVGFSSPAWVGNAATVRVAAGLGLAYVSDLHDPSASGVVPPSADTPLPQPVTNIVGEPGGVGFLEWHRARGAGDDEILADFAERLDRAGDLAVAYDHPFWAGTSDLALTGRLVETAIARGFTVRTLADIVNGAGSG